MSECTLPEFYKWSEPIARKPHKCCECGGVIPKGEKHYYVSGKWDGVMSTMRQHLLCMEACMLIRDELEGECIAFGELLEYWGEHRQYILENGKPEGRDLARMIAKIRVRRRQLAKSQ